MPDKRYRQYILENKIMDIYTKIFFINIILIITIVRSDTYFFDSFLQKKNITFFLLGIWSIGTIISIPVWLIYEIINI